MRSPSKTATQVGLGIVTAVVLAVLGAFQLKQGYLPNGHAQYVAQVLSIQEGGDITPLLHHYPLLPLLVALPLPTMEILLVGGAAGVGLLTAWIWARQPNRYLAGGAAALLVSPLGFELASHHIEGVIGLVFIYIALHHYHQWLTDENTARLFYISIALAVAEYALPYALPLVVVLWLVQDLVRPTAPQTELARGMALVLPTALVVAGWLFVEKTLTGFMEWPMYDFAGPSLPFWWSLVAGAPLFIGALSHEGLWPPRSSIVVLLTVPITIGIAAAFGMAGSLAVGVGFMVVGTLALLPSRISMQPSRGLLVGLIAQVVVIWVLFFPSTPSTAELERVKMERAIANTVEQAPPGQVLTDPRLTYRLIARMGTARSLMTPSVSGYYIATLAPELFVQHVLMGPQLPGEYSSLWQKYHSRVPPRFDVSWSWADYRLLTHDGTPLLRRR